MLYVSLMVPPKAKTYSGYIENKESDSNHTINKNHQIKKGEQKKKKEKNY